MTFLKALEVINKEIINGGIPEHRLDNLSVLIAFKTLSESGIKFELVNNKLGVA